MADIPDDLTDVGTHHGKDAPTETGQTVRSPEGPDPGAEEAQATQALFQIVRAPSGDQISVELHSPRAELSAPEEGEELGQYRAVDALRNALAEAGIDGWTAVFEDPDARAPIVSSDVTPDHSWIGQRNYRTITFFADPEAARTFAQASERSEDHE